MPLKNGHLTPQERVFADAYAQTGDGTYAATKAGYRHPPQNAAKLLQRPAVAAAVTEQAQAVLENEILPLATAAHRRLLTDQRTPAGATISAAPRTIWLRITPELPRAPMRAEWATVWTM